MRCKWKLLLFFDGASVVPNFPVHSQAHVFIADTAHVHVCMYIHVGVRGILYIIVYVVNIESVVGVVCARARCMIS